MALPQTEVVRRDYQATLDAGLSLGRIKVIHLPQSLNVRQFKVVDAVLDLGVLIQLGKVCMPSTSMSHTWVLCWRYITMRSRP